MKILKNFCVFLLLLVCLFKPYCLFSEERIPHVKYVFLFIGDGMGKAQREITERYFIVKKLGPTVMNSLPYKSDTTTHSADSDTTDSAAAGTAIACGEKTNNGILGLSADGKPLESVATAAKKNGKKVGIIATSQLNHATPAAFYAHQNSRSEMFEIALEALNSKFDYFAGGGFLACKDKKKNGKDIFALAEENGYKVVVGDHEAFKNLSAPCGKVLVCESKWEAMRPRISRDAENNSPVLADLVRKGILLLDNPNGFFIMCEGSQIDWFCHQNDIAGFISEMIDFDDAVRAAMEFAKRHSEETLVVVTADHETGGLQAINSDAVNPLLADSKKGHSNEFKKALKELSKRKGEKFSLEDCENLLSEKFGLQMRGDPSDTMTLSEGELDVLERCFVAEFKKRENANIKMSQKETRDNKYETYKKFKRPFVEAVMDCFARRSGARWTRTGHSSQNITTSAYGKGANFFTGKIDNTDIAKILKSMVEN